MHVFDIRYSAEARLQRLLNSMPEPEPSRPGLTSTSSVADDEPSVTPKEEVEFEALVAASAAAASAGVTAANAYVGESSDCVNAVKQAAEAAAIKMHSQYRTAAMAQKSSHNPLTTSSSRSGSVVAACRTSKGEVSPRSLPGHKSQLSATDSDSDDSLSSFEDPLFDPFVDRFSQLRPFKSPKALSELPVQRLWGDVFKQRQAAGLNPLRYNQTWFRSLPRA